MPVQRRSRDPLMALIAVALGPLLCGCFDLQFPGGGVSLRGGPGGGSVNVGFPGGGVNVSGGPFGGNVNVGFPGGGVNVGLGPGGGGVSVAAPGVNLNLGLPGRQLFYQDAGDYPNRSQVALFPPPVKQIAQVAQVRPPIGIAQVAPPPPPAKSLPYAQGAPRPVPMIAPAAPGTGMPSGWVRPDEPGFEGLH